MFRRHRLLFNCLAAALAGCVAFGARTTCRASITIDTVPIGNPGNANDPATGNLFGGVPYDYRIGKYEVTVGQYAAFLNAVATVDDKYRLYKSEMAEIPYIAGIAQSFTSGHYTYSVIGSPNHPVTFVSWGGAARFSNWLQNGQPIGEEGPTTTETGAYTLNGAIFFDDFDRVSRNPDARWFIPSESEWYKSAYYDPATGHYWSYATGSNSLQVSAPPGNTPNTANFEFAVSGSAILDTSRNYLTDVGAYSASASPYGTFDQEGNVWEFNEAEAGGSRRGLRGGSWYTDQSYIPASYSLFFDPVGTAVDTGFRVASAAPEPCTGALAVLGCGALLWCRKGFNA